MYYKMRYDMDSIDDLLEKGESYIYAEQDNLSEVEFEGIKKGFFNTVILKKLSFQHWPNVQFYYSSKAATKESDLLLNASRWPLIHNRVQKAFKDAKVEGVSYYPIELIDVVTGETNNHYSLLYVGNFIDAIDMIRSKYVYNEKYNMYTFVPNKSFLELSKCMQYDIFRCDKSPSSIFVSDKIVDIINRNGFTGFIFVPQKES